MTYSTAQNTAQYITATFVRWQYTIGNQCRYSTSVVSNNFQRYIGIRIIVISNTSTFCSSFDNWINQICFEVSSATLQYRSQSLKTGACINIFML